VLAIPLPSAQRQFVQIDHKVTHYDLVTWKPTTGDIGRGVRITAIKPEDVPELTKRNLINNLEKYTK